jgi:UDP-2-acetamido-3-amino-2,3-dideoxy-glucuronate N-acetyltransferase
MPTENLISPLARISKSAKIGSFNIIEANVEIGENVEIGNFCIIRPNVKIKRGVVIKNYVEIREDTLIDEGSMLDSFVAISGKVKVGKKVTLRYGAILAKHTVISDNCYLSPRVMLNNLNHAKTPIGGPKIGKNCFIGTQAVIQHGIKIGPNVVIGAMSFVNKDCKSGNTYLGIPAQKLEKKKKHGKK